MIPDTSDADKMALIGRLTVLRKARREAGHKLRDKIVPMLNAIEMQGDAWDVSGVVELVDEIKELNQLISELG